MTSVSRSKTTPQSRSGAISGRTISWRHGAFVATVIALTLLAILTWRYQQSASVITLDVDGVERQVRTRASDVQSLFEEIGYQVQAEDTLLVEGERLDSGDRVVLKRARPIILNSDGVQRNLFTSATTVTDALAQAGIILGWRDKIYLADKVAEPDGLLPAVLWQLPGQTQPLMPWEAIAEPLQITVKRSLPVSLMDGTAMPALLYTTAETIAEALAVEQVPVYPGDVIFPSADSAVAAGQLVVIQRSLPYAVTIDGTTTVTRTQQTTVGGALSEQGITVFGMDQVHPSLDTPLIAHSAIEITRVDEELAYEEDLIPFETVWAAKNDLPIDQRRIETTGHPGVLRHRYRIRYEDGEEVSRTLEDSWTASLPENKVIAYGTKITPRTLETPDGTITYWRKLRMYATAYSPRRSGTPRTAPWYGRTRLGKPLQKGYVAVDPGVINMRQELYVPDYGMAMAADTGGGVVGKHIDLGYSDDDYRSWHWWTDVYLLWPPPEEYAIHFVLPDWPRYPDNGR